MRRGGGGGGKLTHSIQVVSEKIHTVESKSDTLVLSLEGKTIPVEWLLVMPDKIVPNDHASAILTPSLLGVDTNEALPTASTDPKGATSIQGTPHLTPFGTVLPATELGPLPFPPRMGDDPRTAMPGLFWAGNAGSALGNIAASVAQGQLAGALAGMQLGTEDLQRESAGSGT